MITKYEGQQWGADVTIMHAGPAMEVDVGWLLQIGEQYLWAVAPNVTIPAHDLSTAHKVKVTGSWFMRGSVGIGNSISAQVVVTPAGNLAPYCKELGNNDVTPKMSPSLKEVLPYVEKTIGNAYKAGGVGGITGIDVGAL